VKTGRIAARFLWFYFGESVVRVKLGTFSALERGSLSLSHCAACGANGEAGPKGLPRT
jgi:hypothetical protein